MLGFFRKPVELSFIVITYHMERELPRTLQSLSRSYQLGSAGINYEVLVVDNGSRPPFGKERVEAYGENFRYLYLENAPSSPAYALNQGVENSRGAIVCLMIDGARIASPGLVRWASAAFRIFADPTVSVLGWHLGPDLQNRSITAGYNQQKEDALLAEIDFPQDGYRLFETSVFAGSCQGGWFLPIGESNAIFLRRESYWSINGYDERFDATGGGLVNLDFYRRAVLRDKAELVILLGEGVFHQIHGGIATNAGEERLKRNIQSWRAQYKKIRGIDFAPPKKRPIYLGTLPAAVLPSVEESARKAAANPAAWE
ncbi:glycosyltransferase family A protein [Nitrosococcus wardiae]|uniref:Glycosyltransferase family 2 protein n=1 Tax=Nitrosococcus wardiae TaxID=1814290 RepID=A0A4P7BUP4_9GAMM|nr:glycosyltransferase family 2 protein [Nitrosococcus wardiae]QBQ53551.1 glycosyltransferase family 2 protein [Nitrosococcus wardiae]